MIRLQSSAALATSLTGVAVALKLDGQTATASVLRSLLHGYAIAQARHVWITDCAQSDVLYFGHMKNEKPTVISSRVYKKHRRIIKSLSQDLKVSEVAIVRLALEQMHGRYSN